MRKRTRKHRGTAGKMVGGFLAFFCLILLTAGMFWAIQGYVFYQKAVKEKPLAQAVEEARSGAQWASLEQVPDLYKKAVLAVEDHRYYTHHGIDWISMARAVVHDIRVMKPEQGGSTITQQLVKNMYYDQNKTFARKAAGISANIRLFALLVQDNSLAGQLFRYKLFQIIQCVVIRIKHLRINLPVPHVSVMHGMLCNLDLFPVR